MAAGGSPDLNGLYLEQLCVLPFVARRAVFLEG